MQSLQGIKKALKKKGICFPTPFTRIQIHWSTSPWTYKDTQEATWELRVWGFWVTTTREDPGSSLEENILKAFPWQQADARDGGKPMKT